MRTLLGWVFGASLSKPHHYVTVLIAFLYVHVCMYMYVDMTRNKMAAPISVYMANSSLENKY